MSQPPAYTPQTEFLTYQAQQAWFPGQQLDVEFNALAASVAAVRANLSLIQKDDTTLGNGTVGWDQLAPSFQLSLRAQGFSGAPVSGPNTWFGLQTFVTGVSLVGANTAAVTTNGSQLNVQNSASKSTDIIAGVVPGSFAYNDGVRSAMVSPAGTNVTNVNGFGSYIRNNAVLSGAAGAAVGYFGIGISAVDNAHTWGGNFALADTIDNVAVATTGRILIGLELDFTVASNNGGVGTGTQVEGISLLLNGLYGDVQAATGLQISLNGNKLAKWTNGIVIDQGTISGAAIFIGQTAAGASHGSQSLVLARTDSGNVGHSDALVNSSVGTLSWSGTAFSSGLILATGGFVAGGGYSYNTYNAAGTFPVITSAALATGYNFSNGSREVDYFNTDTSATGYNSHWWYQQTGASAATRLARLGTTGLSVESGGFAISGTLVATIAGNFTQLAGSDGTNRIFVGNAANFNLFRNTAGNAFQNDAGSTTFLATTSGGTFLGAISTGAATVSYTQGGGLQIGNPTGGDKGAGAINMLAALYNQGNQVVTARQTGWTVATGTPQRSTFTTGGVTLAQLAGVVMALEQDLIAHGLIGT